MPNHSTIPDPNSVITLGHTANVPLIEASSELSDGFEPTASFSSAAPWSGVAASGPWWEGCTRGGAAGGYRGGGIPGTNPASVLRLI